MVALVVVVVGEGGDLPLQITGQEVILEENTVLHSLMPSFDLALGLWVVWCTSYALHSFFFDVIRQVTCNVRRTAVTEQPRFGNYRCPVAAGGRKRQVECGSHVFRLQEPGIAVHRRNVDHHTDRSRRSHLNGWRGRYLDNIFIERLWRSLKQEAIYLEEIQDGFQARRAVKNWMGFYNTERLYSALDRRIPDDAYWASLEESKAA